MLQNTPKMLQKFMFLHRNFICENLNLKNLYFDLSKRVLATEKWNEMTEKYQIQIKRPRVCANYGWKLL